jgi:hypothetical protein
MDAIYLDRWSYSTILFMRYHKLEPVHKWRLNKSAGSELA